MMKRYGRPFALRKTLGRTNTVIGYHLRDHFVDTRAAGAVNGTPGAPGRGNREIADAEGKISVANGWAVVAGGKAVPSWNDPRYRLPNASSLFIARVPGSMFIVKIRPASTSGTMGAVLDDPDTSNKTGVQFFSTARLIPISQASMGSLSPVVWGYQIADYQILAIFRNPSGTFFFIKGGAWDTWTLLWDKETGTATRYRFEVVSYDKAFKFTEVQAIRSHLWVPVPLVSDSFVRANGNLGNTDGAGHPEANGGNGLPWQNTRGTFAINANTAVASALDGGIAIATVDTGTLDLHLETEITRTAGSAGIVLRYASPTDFIYAILDGVNLTIRKVVSGVDSAVLAPTAIVYGAGEKMRAIIEGTALRLFYKGALVGTQQTISDPTLQTGTRAGMYTTDLNNSFRDLIGWARSGYNNLDSYALPLDTRLISVNRVDAFTYKISLPIAGEPSRIRACYKLVQHRVALAGWGFASNCWSLGDLTIEDRLGRQPTYTLAVASAWEYAGRVGVAGAAEGTFDFFGCVHQAEQSLTMSVLLDGVDITALAVGDTAFGSRLVVNQTMNTILPADKVTVIGDSAMVHTIEIVNDEGIITVDHQHNFNPGYEIFTWYTSMLPTSNADGLGCDMYQVGTNPPGVRVYDDGAKNLGSYASVFIGYHSAAHRYVTELVLPYNGPDINGDWSQSGGYRGWYHDRAPNPTGYGKGYVDKVSGNYVERVAAAFVHQVQKYRVYKR